MDLCFSRKPLSLFSQTHQILARVLASLEFSTKTLTQPSSISSIPSALYYRIVAVRDPKVSILPVLDQWVDEGNSIHRDQLVSLAYIMKDYKRFSHALESSWSGAGRELLGQTFKSEISGVERILNLLEENPELGLDWKIYATAASAYLRIGSMEIALELLKKIEKQMPLRGERMAFNYLLTLYANTGNKDELYRVWNAYKPTSTSMNMSYACVIQSLCKLDDIEGAEKIFEEWESKHFTYDFIVLNSLLSAYCNRELFEKAEAALEKAVRGRTPYPSTYKIMAMGHMGHDQMAKAVEMLKKAMLVGRKGWNPGIDFVNSCLDYLEGQGDAEEMQEIFRLLRNLKLLTKDMYRKLLTTCITAGNSVTEVLDQMKADGFAVDEGTLRHLPTSSSL